MAWQGLYIARGSLYTTRLHERQSLTQLLLLTIMTDTCMYMHTYMTCRPQEMRWIYSMELMGWQRSWENCSSQRLGPNLTHSQDRT